MFHRRLDPSSVWRTPCQHLHGISVSVLDLPLLVNPFPLFRGGHKARGRGGGLPEQAYFWLGVNVLVSALLTSWSPPMQFVLSLWEKSETALRKMI